MPPVTACLCVPAGCVPARLSEFESIPLFTCVQREACSMRHDLACDAWHVELGMRHGAWRKVWRRHGPRHGRKHGQKHRLRGMAHLSRHIHLRASQTSCSVHQMRACPLLLRIAEVRDAGSLPLPLRHYTHGHELQQLHHAAPPARTSTQCRHSHRGPAARARMKSDRSPH